MTTHFFKHIENKLGCKIKNTTPVSGGDISQAFKLETNTINYLIKVNSNKNALRMFQAEKLGLETIKATNTIAVPKVFECNVFEKTSFLIMEHIETKHPSTKDFENLGENLADLHLSTSSTFGFKTDNFIGSLTQTNKQHNNWIVFYIEERLLTQFDLAEEKHLLKSSEIPSSETMFNVLSPLFKDIKPTLLHGDLWNGNYLISKDGTPYLIDPAVYYGHNEVDIAMSKLFGGFDIQFYEAYNQVIPSSSETSVRLEIYQLYYLLVHLNLFGTSYYGSVKSILNKYF